MAAAPMIDVSHVCKSFDGGAVRALDDVSLAVPPGGFTAVVGGSGSGKTTLLKTVNRLMEIDSGEVRVAGRPVGEGAASDLRRGIGYVFQGVGLFAHLSVGENIAVTPRLLGWTPVRIAARIAALLDLVRLPQTYAARPPDALSGGERQRVGLARALAAEPRIVLLDEAFGALDPLTRDKLGEEYLALHRELKLTSLLVTHDVQEAVLLADRIAVMRQGRLVAEGTAAELRAETAPAYARDLMAVPERQARRVAARLAGDLSGAAA